VSAPANHVRLGVRAKPGAKHPAIVRAGDGIVVAIRERAVDGAANAAVLRAVARWLGVPASRVALERGPGSRTKVLRIDGIGPEHLAQALARLGADPQAGLAGEAAPDPGRR
jgi:uncharacterized protein YggU (UPF0235/DUF167 family)